MTKQAQAKTVTAGMLVVGDEILSGRTKDKNIGTIADFCADLSIDLSEARIVADEIDKIVEALNALRAKYDYVFTSGGIGPTHDDITADAVAKAFGVELNVDQRAIDAMQKRFVDYEMTPGRLRMARIPEGGELIDNPVSGAPGINIENVYVMAGVPENFASDVGKHSADLKNRGAAIFAVCELTSWGRCAFRATCGIAIFIPNGKNRVLSTIGVKGLYDPDCDAL